MKSISNASEVTNRKKSVTQELDDALERAEILAQGESLNKLYNISEILQDKSNKNFLKNWLPSRHQAAQDKQLGSDDEY